MKRFLKVLSLGIVLSLLSSCEQPTMLSVSQTALSFENSGGNQSVTLTANKVWTASSNQGWLRVSPSSGEGTATLSISCEGNTTYDSRTGNITIVSEELTQTISVTQAEGLGLLISQPEYNLSNEAQTIDVTVQANVQYTVDIDNACRDWIKQESTKGLSSNIIKFAISKNESYDGREGKITIRQTNGNLSATVIVKQSQTNGLFAEKTEYEVSYEEQQLNIKVKSNVDYDVQIDDSCKDWISRVQTKGLTESTVSLAIANNEGKEREGKIILKYGGVEEAVRISQGGGFVEFEDANFKAYCIENFDKDGDGVISLKEAASVLRIEVCTDDIVSLKGIEFFNNLSYLRCNGSFNVYQGIYEGKLTNLDVSKNTGLKYLYCEKNMLKTLDVSQNTELTELECHFNQLKALDVSRNTALKVLVSAINPLSELDVSKNTALTTLSCSDNNLTALDITKNTALTWLDCAGNKLTTLDVSKNASLTRLDCNSNQLMALDFSQNPELKILNCCENRLTVLDVSKNIELETLICYINKITALDVSKSTKLGGLYCYNNKLCELDVSRNTALIELECGDNQLTVLDVSMNTELTWLSCNKNLLTSLNVSNNLKLSYLQCRNNPSLTKIWLKTGQKIVDFRYDKDTATVYYVDGLVPFEDANFKAYCVQKFDTDGDGEISYNEAQSITIIKVKTDDIKSLKGIEYFKNLSVLDCQGTYDYEWDSSLNGYVAVGHGLLTTLDLRKNTALTKLYCSANHLTSLDLSQNTALTTLYCQTNLLANLDLSHNTALTTLYCKTNQLTHLDLSGCPLLTEMIATYNQLSSLDVSHNSALTYLDCDSNQLTGLDVSHNTVLSKLYCSSNQLTSLDVSHNPTLSLIHCSFNLLTSLDVSNNALLNDLYCKNNPYLLEIWLKTGQTIKDFQYDTDVATVKYK